MNMYLVATKIILAITLLIGISLLMLLAKQHHSRLHRVLITLISASTSWTFFIFINLWLKDLLIESFIFASATVLIVAQLWFAKLFKKDSDLSPLHWWSLVVGLFFVIASFIPGAIFSTIEVTDLGYTIVKNGTLKPFFFLFSITCIVGAIVGLILKYRRQTNLKHRQQFKYLIFGYISYFLIGLTTNLILPTFFNFYFLNGIGPIFSIFLIGLILYIIDRYQFLNIKAVFQRSLIHSTLLTIIIAFYLLLVFAVGQLFADGSHAAILLSAGITTVIGIFTVPALERYFRQLTNLIFFKDIYDYSQVLHELSEILNENVEVKNLLCSSNQKLRQIFKPGTAILHFYSKNLACRGLGDATPEQPKAAKIIKDVTEALTVESLDDEEYAALDPSLRQYCEQEHIAVVVPIKIRQRLIGSIMLGDKRSGDPYSKKDIKLIRTFAAQAAVALEKARLYEAEKKHALQLEQRVARRTKKIHDLQEEQKMMILDISHDLQTPLTIAKIEIENLKQQRPLTKEILAFEKTIDWISKFIYDLLKLAKLEMPDSFKKEPVNFSQLMSEMVEYFEVLADDKGIDLRHQIKPGIIISGDKRKLEELVTNLMSNAVKFIGHDKQITIALQKKSGFAVLTVKDTGIGIPKKNLEQIFKRFYMAKMESAGMRKGSGLGLAISKRIVDGHDGTITVKSCEGKGSTFTVTLPQKALS